MVTAVAHVLDAPATAPGNGPTATRLLKADAQILDPRSDSEWDADVLSHPEHTFFHSAAWADVLCRTYGHRCSYLRLTEAGKLLALVPLLAVESRVTGRRAVCLPFTDRCSPLEFSPCGRPAVRDQLAQMAHRQDWKYVELRGDLANAACEAPPTFYGHTLDLTAGAEALLAGFDTSVRRAIRKAERSQLTVGVADTLASVEQFYRLHVRTRRRHGVPPQPFSFFSNIHEAAIKRGLGFVVHARLASRPIAGAIFLRFGTHAVYKFGASDERLQELRGNNLVMWEGIKQLVADGSHTLHFGRTDCHQDGLRRFKRAWGAREEPIFYSRFGGAKNAWVNVKKETAKGYERIFRSLPFAVNRLAGTFIYPHLD